MFRVLFLIVVLLSSAAFSLFSKPVSTKPKPFSPVPKPTSLMTLDLIGKSSEKDLIARFSVLGDKLKKEADVIAFIITRGTKSQLKKRERQIRKALAIHKIDSERVKLISTEDSDDFRTEIYLIPGGVKPPSFS